MTGPKINTKRHNRPMGSYVSVYLDAPLADYVEKAAKADGETAPTWIRNLVLDHVPEDVAAEARALLKYDRVNAKPGRPRKVEAQPAAGSQESVSALAEIHRERVLELESRGYLRMQIASTLKVSHALIDHILSTKATPKKKMKS